MPSKKENCLPIKQNDLKLEISQRKVPTVRFNKHVRFSIILAETLTFLGVL